MDVPEELNKIMVGQECKSLNLDQYLTYAICDQLMQSKGKILLCILENSTLDFFFNQVI